MTSVEISIKEKNGLFFTNFNRTVADALANEHGGCVF